jgi:hypothetical protein
MYFFTQNKMGESEREKERIGKSDHVRKLLGRVRGKKEIKERESL